MLIIGILIGIISVYVYMRIQNNLRKKNIELDHARVMLALLATIICLYLIYSFVGMVISPAQTNSKGQACKSINYGMTICH